MSVAHGWVGSTLLAVFLAGCTGSSASPNAQPQASSIVEATGEPLADAGSIRVTVVDDSALPLAGATVGVTDLALNAVTDPTGVAVFTNLAPGMHQIAAARLGYSSAAKAVSVEAGVEAATTLSLVAIVVEIPFHETFGPLQGYFDCRMGATTYASTWTAACGTVGVPFVGLVGPPAAANPWTSDNSVLKFPIANNNTATAIGDMQWTPSAVGTSTALRFAFSYEGRPSTHWWCAAEGGTPLQWRWEAEGESVCTNVGSSDEEPFPRTHNNDGEPMTMRVYANAPFGTLDTPLYLTLQQRFEIITTIFYSEPAPEGYSGFADA
jgi:hypothetical protein